MVVKKEKEEGPTPEELRENLQLAARTLVEKFLYDLGLLLSGNKPDFSYVDPITVGMLQQATAPFLASGERLSPDFGEWVGDLQLKIDEDDPERAVSAVVEFEEQSVQENEQKGRLRHPQRWMRIEFLLQHDGSRILAARFLDGRDDHATEA